MYEAVLTGFCFSMPTFVWWGFSSRNSEVIPIYSFLTPAMECNGVVNLSALPSTKKLIVCTEINWTTFYFGKLINITLIICLFNIFLNTHNACYLLFCDESLLTKGSSRQSDSWLPYSTSTISASALVQIPQSANQPSSSCPSSHAAISISSSPSRVCAPR